MSLKSFLPRPSIPLIIGMLTPVLLCSQVSEAIQDLESGRASEAYLENGWNLAPGSGLELDTNTDSNSELLTSEVLTYLRSDNKLEQSNLLIEAYSSNPADRTLWPYVLLHYGMKGDVSSQKEMAKKMKESNLVPLSQLEIHRYMLQTLDEDDILISHGLWDTASLLIVQSETNSNIPVISLDWLRDATFRTERLNSLGLVAPELKSSAAIALLDLQTKNAGIDVHLAPTLNKPLLKALRSQLSISGLSFSLSPEPDDTDRILQTWELLKNGRSRTSGFSPSYSPWHKNYLPILARLESYFTKVEAPEDASLCRKWMDDITKGLGLSKIPED